MDKKLFTAEKIADVLEEMFIKDRFIKWDGTNLRDVVTFTGLHKNFSKWFLSWHEYEEYVNEHGGIFKIFGENGYYEVPVGSWIVKAPDGLNYAFGEGVKYVYDGYEYMKGVIEHMEGIVHDDEEEIPIGKPEEPITTYYPEDPYETEVVQEGNAISLRRKLDENGNPIWKKGFNPAGRWKASVDLAKGKDKTVTNIYERKPYMEKFKAEVERWVNARNRKDF